MALPIEAHSLSTLIKLAADPPQYPRNVTHEPLQPLTLYIVRVPGSQDVFLTPLRPPTRASISADAINTSLYYLHVARAEELALQESVNAQQSSPIENSPTKSIHRKPLPKSLHTNDAHQRSDAPPNGQVDNQPNSPDAPNDSEGLRHVFHGQSLPVPNTENALNPSVARKPMGPRAFPGRTHSIADGTIRRKPVAHAEGSGRPRANTEGRIRPLEIPGASNTETQKITPSAQHPPSKDLSAPHFGGTRHASQGDDASASVQITIIRRDPTSGTQWNVGRITFSNDGSSPDSRRVELQITTPGYQKFNRESSWPKMEDMDISSLLKNKADLLSTPMKLQTGGSQVTPNSPDSHVFTRYLTMPRSRTSKPQSSRRRSSSDPSTLIQNSISRVTAPAPAIRPPVFVPQLNSPQSKTQEHFSFTSPWNGRCTFSTAMDGRSLKARHVITSPNATNEDSNVPAPVVVELRFNLPWPTVNFSALRKRDASVEKERMDGRSRPSLADTAKSSLKSSMQRLRERGLSRDLGGPLSSLSHEERYHGPLSLGHAERHSFDAVDHDSDSEGEHQPLDLSLGREKAGGGRGGQSAKLGKLIIRDEGLKMMDLIVAAGMGVWWGIHNREK